MLPEDNAATADLFNYSCHQFRALVTIIRSYVCLAPSGECFVKKMEHNWLYHMLSPDNLLYNIGPICLSYFHFIHTTKSHHI